MKLKEDWYDFMQSFNFVGPMLGKEKIDTIMLEPANLGDKKT